MYNYHNDNRRCMQKCILLVHYVITIIRYYRKNFSCKRAFICSMWSHNPILTFVDGARYVELRVVGYGHTYCHLASVQGGLVLVAVIVTEEEEGSHRGHHSSDGGHKEDQPKDCHQFPVSCP